MATYNPLLQSRLRVLEYPRSEIFNILETKQVREVVAWLEDQKVRYFHIKQRDHLRQINVDQWDTHFQNYLKSLKCPDSFLGNLPGQLMWLLNHAIHLEYAQKPDVYNKCKETGEQVDEGALFKGIDVQGDQFKSQVGELATKLKVTPHPNHLVTFEACCILLEKLTNPKPITPLLKGQKESLSVDFQSNPLGVPKEIQKEPGLCEALKILRLLNLKDLRALQDEINNTIEQVQVLTANPKTDTSLGKVGR